MVGYVDGNESIKKLGARLAPAPPRGRRSVTWNCSLELKRLDPGLQESPEHAALNDLPRAQRRNRLRPVAQLPQDVVRIGATFGRGAHQAARGPA